MSTIFGHGRLRLYLLKLLDESPRHGYEIISLLRDRFLGVYSPSPGTIYPRLARLEEEGLVTHEEVDGRKVYRLTDRGREELRNRSEDIDDLEREITDSVRDVAEAVREDVRDTISSLRRELKFGGAGRRTRDEGARTGASGGTSGSSGAAGGAAGAGAAGAGGSARDSGGAEGESGTRGGSWWARDWERFTQGFGNWGKRTGGERPASERPEFDQALRDFTDRVRDMAREAGQVGESAAHDLRRILDETFETIRRDVGGWGPRDTEQDGPCGDGHTADCGHGSAGTAGSAKGTADREPGVGKHERTDKAPGSTSPGGDAGPGSTAPGAGSTGPAASGDAWSAAVDDPTHHPGGTSASGTAGPAEQTGETTGPAESGDTWSAAVDDPTHHPGGTSASGTTGPAEQTGETTGPGDEPGQNHDTTARTESSDPWSTAVNDDEEPDERRGGADT